MPQPDASKRRPATKPALVFPSIVLGALALLIVFGTISGRAEVVPWPLTALDIARQRATSIGCLNNLKQIALAGSTWASDHVGAYPTGIQVLTNELGSATPLFCPANASRIVPTNWIDVDWSRIDYHWIVEANWENPANVICRCRIHDNEALADGSVGQGAGYRAGWPAILAAPLSLYATPGSTARFDVVIAPNALLPLAYQWRRETLSYVTQVTFVEDPDDPQAGYWSTNTRPVFAIAALNGETNASLVITNVQASHSEYYYSVMASNPMGASASSPTRLTVDPVAAVMATNSYWSAAHCVNNLKQIALFGRMLANDYGDVMPVSFASMTNWLGSPIFGWPIVLYCRSDTARTAPVGWSGVDFGNVSYEMLPAESEPNAPFCRCKIHGFYAQVSGDVVFRSRVERIRRLNDNTTELNLATFAGQSNVLEASTNLVHWDFVTTLTTTNSTFNFHETNALSQRFYRIRTE